MGIFKKKMFWWPISLGFLITGLAAARDTLNIDRYLSERTSVKLWVDFENKLTMHSYDYIEEVQSQVLMGHTTTMPFILFKAHMPHEMYMGVVCQRDRYALKLYLNQKNSITGEKVTSYIRVPMKLSLDECEELAANHFMDATPQRPIEVEIIKKDKPRKSEGFWRRLFNDDTEEELYSYHVEINFRGTKVYADDEYLPYWTQDYR